MPDPVQLLEKMCPQPRVASEDEFPMDSVEHDPVLKEAFTILDLWSAAPADMARSWVNVRVAAINPGANPEIS